MAAILDALDPRVGANPMQKYGPLLVTVVTVGVAVAAIFGFVPGMDAVSGLAMLGAGAGGYSVRSQA